MANILDLDLNISGFSEDKKKTLNEYISLFEKLEKFESREFKIGMGGGLAEFNTALTQTTSLLDDLNAKLVQLNTEQKNQKGSTGVAKKSTDEFSLSMQQLIKLEEQAAVTQAKLNVLTTDQAKETMALKLKLSETIKEILAENKANTASGNAKEYSKQKSREYREEQQRVVQSLRALAVEQDKEQKQIQKDNKAEATRRSREYREEQRRVVEALRALAKEQDKEEKQNSELLSDYEKLKKALQEQIDLYRKLALEKGKNSAEAKEALKDVAATSGVISDVDSELGKATGSGNQLGSALRSAFGSLRTIAYILPGIGIAGIFNLAYTAIAKALDSLDLFSNKLEKQLLQEKEITEALRDQMSLRQTIYDNANKLNLEQNLGSSVNMRRRADLLKAQGYSTDRTIPEDINVAQREYDEAKSKVIPGDVKRAESLIREQIQLKKLIDRIQIDLTDPKYDKKKAEAAQDQLIKSLGPVTPRAWIINMLVDYKEMGKADLERKKTSVELYKAEIDEKVSNLQTFNEKSSNLDNLRAEQQKKNSDEERDMRKEAAKNALEVTSAKASFILNKEVSSERQRISALKTLRDADIKKNYVEYNDIVNNISSTSAEKRIASSKLEAENRKAELKFEEDSQKLREDYRQRRLKASTELRKDEIEQDAIANEKIFKNDEKSLEQRIAAYNRYIVEKQALQNLEYLRDRDKLSLRAKNDPTAKVELEALESNKNLLQRNIQADTQRQVFEIVSTSLDKELKDIIDTNRLEEENNKQHYAKELEGLNKSLDDKKITYHRYKLDRANLDEKFKVSGLDANIEDDKVAINRIKLFRDNLKKELEDANNMVAITAQENDGSLDKKRDYDTAVGQRDALNVELLKSDKQLKTAQEKLDEDTLNRAKAKNAQLEDFEKEHTANRKKISQELYSFLKQYADSSYEREAERIEKIRQQTNESYDSQISAVEKSSLSEKNKAALDIQLGEQKREADKLAQQEERKIKHDQAVMDRDLALAYILWETEQAVMAALKLPPPAGESLAIERGILGAIAAAKIATVNIPSYSEGTLDHPGGPARTGEGGKPELIFEPYKSPYIVWKENVSFLPKHTQVIPLKDNPDFSSKEEVNSSWEQTRYLAKEIRKNNKGTKVNNTNIININLGTEGWAKRVLGN